MTKISLFFIPANLWFFSSEDSPVIESVGLLDEQEPSSFINPETGNFNLDLPETSEEIIEEADTTETASLSLDTAVDLIEELAIDEPIAIDETASVNRYWKSVSLKEPTLFLEPALEISELESEEVALDLGENEIALDLNDSPSNSPRSCCYRRHWMRSN